MQKKLKWVLNNFEYLHTSEARKENVFIHKLRMKTSQCEDVELLSHSTMVDFRKFLSKNWSMNFDSNVYIYNLFLNFSLASKVYKKDWLVQSLEILKLNQDFPFKS